jgi:Rrf2 family protein
MSLITRDIDYALRAVCCIAKKKEEMCSASGLVNFLKIPRPFLRKILQVLNKGGILHSYKGKRGGFKLARLAEKISLFDVIVLFRRRISLNDHTFRRKICPRLKRCNIKKKLDRIDKMIVIQLKAVTIADVI